MTTAHAPAPATSLAGPLARAPVTADGAASADRAVERALPAAVALRLGVVVAGLVVVAATGSRVTAATAVAATALAADAARPLLRRAARPDRGRPRHAALVVPVLAIVASGGWASPFGAVLTVDLALVGLARGYRRAFAAAVVVAAAGLAGSVVAGGTAAPGAGSTPLPLLLVLGAALGGYAHGLAAGEHHPELGHTLHLADANRLVADLHDTLRTLPTSPDAGTVARTAFDWLRREVPFTAAALVARDGARASVVHAEGVALSDDEATVLVAAAPAEVTETPAGDVRLTRAGRTTGWLPLAVHGRDLGLLVLEHDAPPCGRTRQVLAALGGPLGLALDTARWFARLATLAGEPERSRLAGDLADRLCQSMATTVFTLDRAAVRTGDTELFRLADGVRADVADLRRTLDDLRASVTAGDELADVVAGVLDRAGERGGYLTALELDAPTRPSAVVEQQVLRSLQELLGAVTDATTVTVRWRSHAEGLLVSVASDGRLVVPSSVADRADAIGASVAPSAAPGGAVLTLSTEVPS